ncbi:MAG TPA: hypothetical protein VFO58_05920 [Vicinamibacterales bacterium]|nr:hypothetical protein [Vicinamibacterales bacterium]
MAHEAPALTTIRTILLWALVLGATGMAAELLLIGHDESASQLVPLALLGAGVLLGASLVAVPSAWSLRLLQLLMVLFVGSGMLGVALHYQGNAEFELEMHPSLSGMKLITGTMTGATPVLAPGSMSLLGVVGLAFTYRHPLLRSHAGVASTEEAQS